MARFFFHVHDGTVYRDVEGSDLEDVGSAKVQAIQIAVDLLRGRGSKFWNEKIWSIQVADDVGRPVLTLTLEAVVPL